MTGPTGSEPAWSSVTPAISQLPISWTSRLSRCSAKRWIAGTVSDRRFAEAVDDLGQLDMDRYPTLRFMRRAYELRANVTVYDSAYVALAEVLGCELLTADQRLAAAAGPRCAIRVLQ